MNLDRYDISSDYVLDNFYNRLIKYSIGFGAFRAPLSDRGECES